MYSRKHELAAAAVVGSLLVILGVAIYRKLEQFGKEISDTISNGGFNRFTREHGLPSGYLRHMRNDLPALQALVREYCARHKGQFPSSRDAAETRRLLKPNLGREHALFNPATGRPFEANLQLRGRRWSEITDPDRTILFYDPSPPPTYLQVYFVMVSGRVGHVDGGDWIELYRASAISPSPQPGKDGVDGKPSAVHP